MGRSCFSRVLLLSFLLLLFSTGFGRKLVDASGNEEQAVGDSEQGKSRAVMELDYEEAGPNTNGKSGYLFPFPSPSPSGPLSPPPGLGH